MTVDFLCMIKKITAELEVRRLSFYFYFFLLLENAITRKTNVSKSRTNSQHASRSSNVIYTYITSLRLIRGRTKYKKIFSFLCKRESNRHR